MLIKNHPKNEEELLYRSQKIEGLSFGQLAEQLQWRLPTTSAQRKGWVGQAIEQALGARAGSKPVPDFYSLGIELKTIPLNRLGKPAESTYVTNIPLLTIHQQSWKTSACYTKLQRVLWVPVEGDSAMEFAHRRIGSACLWSPSRRDELVLAADWEAFMLLITTGRLAEIDAEMGQYLQIRPKAANGKSLCYGYDEEGNKIKTLPRGFYLRSRFTAGILG